MPSYYVPDSLKNGNGGSGENGEVTRADISNLENMINKQIREVRSESVLKSDLDECIKAENIEFMSINEIDQILYLRS